MQPAGASLPLTTRTFASNILGNEIVGKGCGGTEEGGIELGGWGSLLRPGGRARSARRASTERNAHVADGAAADGQPAWCGSCCAAWRTRGASRRSSSTWRTPAARRMPLWRSAFSRSASKVRGVGSKGRRIVLEGWGQGLMALLRKLWPQRRAPLSGVQINVSGDNNDVKVVLPGTVQQSESTESRTE